MKKLSWYSLILIKLNAGERNVKKEHRSWDHMLLSLVLLIYQYQIQNVQGWIQPQTFAAGNRWQNRFTRARTANGRRTVIVSKMLSKWGRKLKTEIEREILRQDGYKGSTRSFRNSQLISFDKHNETMLKRKNTTRWLVQYTPLSFIIQMV